MLVKFKNKSKIENGTLNKYYKIVFMFYSADIFYYPFFKKNEVIECLSSNIFVDIVLINCMSLLSINYA